MTTFNDDKHTAAMPLPDPDAETGVHEATAAIPARQAASAFNNSASVLLAANAWSGVENASSKSTLAVSNPYAESMHSSLKASGSGMVPA